jgi:hypothetical protein
LHEGEKISMSEITDQFVELNRDERAEPNAVNVSVYRESQGLQNEISLAFRTVLAKHRKFVLAKGHAPVDFPSGQ